MSRLSLWVLVGLLCLGLEGCVWPVMTETQGQFPVELGKEDQVFYWDAPRPKDLTKDFGKSFKEARDNQILNPEASENLEPVEGLDGNAGVNAMGRYHKFFEKPPFGSSKKGSK